MPTYKGISLKQPFANWVASGKKTIETRTWTTKYRGDLLICSSKNPKIEPAGLALCIVELHSIEPMTKEHEDAACCEVYNGAYSWFLRNLRKVDPIFPVKGQLGICETKLPKDVTIKAKKS